MSYARIERFHCILAVLSKFGLDNSALGDCSALVSRVLQPRAMKLPAEVHLFGHIHEQRGQWNKAGDVLWGPALRH